MPQVRKVLPGDWCTPAALPVRVLRASVRAGQVTASLLVCLRLVHCGGGAVVMVEALR
jgi:hypothetical protein